MSAYFAGPKPGGGRSLLPNPALAPQPKAAPPTRTVKVRAHTRAVPVKKARASAPVPAVKPAPSLNTQMVRPAQVSTAVRLQPHYRGEPPAGYVNAPVTRGRWQPGKATRPYYTDVYTAHHGAGPVGQESTQWSAADVAKAHAIQRANYGLPGYVLRSAIPGGLDESGVTGPTKALERGADIASMVLPGGGVGEAARAAGVLGFGLKALRGARGAKAVEEAAPVAKAVVEGAPAA